jgi:flagellar hook-associated protein 2
MLKARKTQISSLEQKSTILSWKQTDYQTIYGKVKDLGDTAFNNTLVANLAPLKSTNTNESVATTTVTASTEKLSHQLTVKQLAGSIYTASSAQITPSGNDKSTLASQFGITADFSVVINGKTISVSKDASLNTFVSSINNANAGVTAVYSTTVDRFFLSTSVKGAWDGEYGSRIDFAGTSTAGMDFFTDNLKMPLAPHVASNATITPTGNAKTSLATQFGITAGTDFDISVNGTTLNVDTDDSIDTLISDINALNAGVTASYSADLDRVIFTGTGTTPQVTLSGDTEGLAFLTDNLKVMAEDSRMMLGQDAIVDIDGATNMHVLDNTFAMAGVTYTLKGTGTTNVEVVSDIDKAVENAKAFVDKYNSVLSDIITKYKESRPKQTSNTTGGFEYYQPLTDEQREAMSDDQISAWEAKAKTGMLSRSPILGTILDKMRTSISQPVSGVTGDYKSAASLGITTGEGWESYQEGGKLYLDESTLREALTADPDAMKTVFGTTGTTTAKQGIAVRIKAVMDAGKTSISDEAGLAGSDVSTGFLGDRISEYSKQIYNLTLKMNDEEDRYYNQFSAMESALQKLSAQSSWLAQQTGQSSSSSG